MIQTVPGVQTPLNLNSSSGHNNKVTGALTADAAVLEMSDTDDTDVLVLIPHDFFTVSSSEDERPLTEVSRPLHRRFYSPNMSDDKNCTPNKPTSLTSPLKNGDNTPKRPVDYSSFRSPSKSDYTPPKSFQPSPSSKGLYSKEHFQDSPRFHQSGGAIPKSGILSTCDNSSPTSRLRRSTSDLPTMPDGSRMDLSMQGNNQRQRSLTGEIILSGLEARENHLAGGEVAQRNHDQAPKPTSVYRNPEQPEYDTESQLHGTPKENTKPKEADKTPQPYIGENQNLPFVCGDNIGSIPDLGFGLREFLASLKPSHPQSRKTPTEPVHEEPCVKKNFYSLGGEASTSSGFSVPRRQLNFDEHGEVLPVSSQDDKLNMSAVKRPSAFVPVGSGDTRIIGEHQTASLHSEMSRPELTGSTATRSPSTALPSLAQLWHDGGDTLPKTPTSGPSLLHQKLEEEKYRRLHCEQLICELQQKLLRESERVAVATQVDARKDDYLGRLRERYDSAARHWHAERERLLLDVAEKNEMCSATIQRLRGCERELSKALDLASGFQQRSLELERDKTETEAKLQARVLSLERQCSLLEQEIMKQRAAANITEQHENKRGDQMAALQNLVEDEREERRKLEAENKRLLREAEEKEAAALTLEAERDAQQAKLRDNKQRCDLLEQQKNALQQSLEELKKKEKCARQEVRELSQAMEQSRQSLKEQYQAQLDQVVRAKLAEFQAQLDTAETALRQQWENRETEARNKHTRALSEVEQRHLGELRQVEERHARDIAWWQRSLSQAMAQIQELTSELERQEKHREQLAGKIKSMLQAQYQQAATLIWEPPTDGTNGSAKSNGGEFKGWGSLPSVNQCGMGRSQTQPATSASENQLSEAGTGTKTVLSSYAQAELKKYIEMLLQRPPGDPLHFEGQSQGTSSKTSYIPELDLSKLSINLPEKSKTSKDNQKPPWK